MNDMITRESAGGLVECRICGLKYFADDPPSREEHELDHLRILCGALPYDIREFIKRAAWQTLSDPRASEQDQEIAKRAIAFASWARAIGKSIPENHFEPFIAAHLADLDAEASGNEEKIEEAEHLTRRWNKYG